MARALLAQAALATAEKRVEECINLIREVQVLSNLTECSC